MADSNKVVFGIKNCYYAPLTINSTTGTGAYTTPVALPGAVSLSMDAQGDTNKFYADNIVYYVSAANNGYEGTLELAKIPDDFLVDILGFIRDGSSVLVEDASAPVKHFALTFQFEGDQHARRHVLYNCTASRPAISGATVEESVTPQTQTINISATTIYNAVLNKDVVKASATPSESVAYNAWNTTIYQTAST